MEQINPRSLVALIRAERDLYAPYEKGGQNGWVYFIGTPFLQAVKIGWAKCPIARLDQISKLSPLPLVLLTGQKGSVKDEQALHRRFVDHRYHGEWFRFEGPVIDYFDEVKAKNGVCPWPPLKHESSVREPRIWTKA